jgi:hypothetical protein
VRRRSIDIVWMCISRLDGRFSRFTTCYGRFDSLFSRLHAALVVSGASLVV